MPQRLCLHCGPLFGAPSQSPTWKIPPPPYDHASSVSYSVSTCLGLSLIPHVVSFWSLLSFALIYITVFIVPNDSFLWRSLLLGCRIFEGSDGVLFLFSLVSIRPNTQQQLGIHLDNNLSEWMCKWMDDLESIWRGTYCGLLLKARNPSIIGINKLACGLNPARCLFVWIRFYWNTMMPHSQTHSSWPPLHYSNSVE